MWRQTLEIVIDSVRNVAKAEPAVWTCPCSPGCPTRVAYARNPNGVVFFRCTLTFAAEADGEPNMFGLEHAEDFEDLLYAENVNEADRVYFARMFNAGLRDALLAAL